MGNPEMGGYTPEVASPEDEVRNLSEAEFKKKFPENGVGWIVPSEASDGTDLTQTPQGRRAQEAHKRWEEIKNPENSPENQVNSLSDEEFMKKFPENGVGWVVPIEEGENIADNPQARRSVAAAKRWEGK